MPDATRHKQVEGQARCWKHTQKPARRGEMLGFLGLEVTSETDGALFGTKASSCRRVGLFFLEEEEGMMLPSRIGDGDGSRSRYLAEDAEGMRNLKRKERRQDAKTRKKIKKRGKGGGREGWIITGLKVSK